MMQSRSRVDLYAAIRRDARSGMSKPPKERKQPPKRGSRLDAYRVVIDAWLCSDLDAPRKQPHTRRSGSSIDPH